MILRCRWLRAFRPGWAPCALLAAGIVCVGGPRLRGLLGNTAWLAAGALAVGLPCGLFWGVVAAKIDVQGRRALQSLLVALLLTPLTLQAAGWQAALGSGGWLVGAVGAGEYASWLAGWPAAMGVHAMAGAGWAAVLVWAALSGVERPYEEQALLDGSPGQVLCRISLPQAASGLLAAALWFVVSCGVEIAAVDFFLTAPGQNTLAEEIYVAANLGTLLAPEAPPGGRSGGPLASTDLVWGTLVLALAALAGMAAIAPRLPAALAVAPAPRWRWSPRRGRRLWTAALAATATLAAGVPLASLLWQAGVTVEAAPEGFRRSWSALAAVERVVASPWEHRREWQWTLLIAGPAALLSWALAVHGAWAVRIYGRRRPVVGAAALALVALAAAIPSPLASVGVIRLLNPPPSSAWAWASVLYDRTLLAPILVQAERSLAWTALVAWALLERVPEELLDAARADGAGAWRQLWRIAIPYQARGLAAAALVAAALAAGELSGTVLATPPGVTPVAVRLFGLLHYGMDERAAALSLSLCAGAGGLTFLLLKLFARPQRYAARQAGAPHAAHAPREAGRGRGR